MQKNSAIRVLIVDDSKLTVVGLKTTLKNHADIEIAGTAENGQAAILSIQELKPDIVLMDIGMPVMDGIQATREAKKLGLETKIIMLTSHDNQADVFDALSAGAYSYCMKDIDPDMLISVIKSTHSGACWLDPSIAGMVLNNFANKTAKIAKETNSPLTEREINVLSLIAKGYSNFEISAELYISLNTVKTHIKNIFQKLEVKDRTQAAMKVVPKAVLTHIIMSSPE